MVHDRLPQLGNAALFPRLTARVYLAHAAISPASTPVQEAVLEVLSDYAARGVGAFLRWQEQREGLRGRLAQLVGSSPAEIALTPSTTRGIVDLALALPWRAGDRVILFDGEFPTNVTPWQQAAELFQLELVTLSAEDFRTGTGLEQLEAELRRGARLVAVSAVQFQTGLRMPLKTMGQLCRQHGCELFVDAIQALGVVPLNLRELAVDYLSCGSHKWLLGLEGAGFLFVRQELQAALKPRTAGWKSHQSAEDFLFRGAGHLRYDRPLKPDARVFEPGTDNVAGFAALEASLQILMDLGIDAIYTHVQRYHDALEPAFESRGLESVRPRAPDQRSGSLSFRAPGDVDPVALQGELAQRGIVCSLPDGLLRCAPHFHNSLEQVEWVTDALDQSLATLT